MNSSNLYTAEIILKEGKIKAQAHSKNLNSLFFTSNQYHSKKFPSNIVKNRDSQKFSSFEWAHKLWFVWVHILSPLNETSDVKESLSTFEWILLSNLLLIFLFLKKKVAEVKVTWLIWKTILAPLLFEIFQVHLVTVLIFPSQNMMKSPSKNWITRQYADVVRPGENLSNSKLFN